MGDCEGCLVGLFDPAVSAAAADSLAGPMMGAAPRARRRHRCGGEVTRTRLMVEDGAASPALRDGGDAAYKRGRISLLFGWFASLAAQISLPSGHGAPLSGSLTAYLEDCDDDRLHTGCCTVQAIVARRPG